MLKSKAVVRPLNSGTDSKTLQEKKSLRKTSRVLQNLIPTMRPVRLGLLGNDSVGRGLAQDAGDWG